MRLNTRLVEKVWGRDTLPDIFAPCDERIGEIWFEGPEDQRLDLLVKYLFTSERLSVQVHPSDRKARRLGLNNGKEECWYILSAEPGAKIGLGLTKSVRPAKLRAAAQTGAIESLLDWKAVKAGDFFYVPAGTIHAIGAGLSLIEVQQNSDTTYRLYDYGRPRELHLDDAVAVATAEPYDMAYHDHVPDRMSAVLVDGPLFRLFQIIGSSPGIVESVEASEWHILPLEGSVLVDGEAIAPGQCGLCFSLDQIDLSQNKKCLVAVSME